jgi:hypothetical protein
MSIARLLNGITNAREFVFSRRLPRYISYFAAILMLLLFWLYYGHAEVSFVYSDF